MGKPSLEEIFAESKPISVNRPSLENIFSDPAVNEPQKQEPAPDFGIAESFKKKLGLLAGPIAFGPNLPKSGLESGPFRIGEIFGRISGGEADFKDLDPLARSFMSGVSRTAGEAAAQIPSAVYAGHKYVTKNLPMLAVSATAKKMGLVPETFQPEYDKVPDWLLNNPLSEFFGKAAKTLNYNQQTYGNENAFTLYGKGDINAALDWTANAVAENLPFALFTTAMTVAGVPANVVFTASSALAGLGMMKEEFKNQNLDEIQKIHSLAMKASAEGLSEYAGAKIFPFAAGLFKKVGVNAGKEAIKSSIKRSLAAVAVGPMEEGIEEFATGVAQGAVDMYYKAEDDLSWANVMQRAALDGYLGAASGGVYSAGAAMQASLEIGNPELIIEGIAASEKNLTDGIDTRMTLEELLEVKASLNAKNKGLERPETGEPMTIARTLSAQEVELLQRVENDILSGNFKEPQAEAIKSLGEAISGDIVVNMANESFDDSIREKLASGEELEVNEKAYLEAKREKAAGIKKADAEAAKTMSSEDYLTWANDRARPEYKTRQELLDAAQLHKSFIDASDLESAQEVRKNVPRETLGAEAVIQAMETAENQFAQAGDSAIIDSALAEKYAALEELDNISIGEITPEYEEKAKNLIQEIKELEEQKAALKSAGLKRENISHPKKDVIGDEAKRFLEDPKLRTGDAYDFGLKILSSQNPSQTIQELKTLRNAHLERLKQFKENSPKTDEAFKKRTGMAYGGQLLREAIEMAESILQDKPTGSITADNFEQYKQRFESKDFKVSEAKYEKHTEYDGSSVEKKAQEVFGKTLNLNEAGYLLSDGSMLDFSGRHDAVGYEKGKPKKDDYLAGDRNTDHREIYKAYPDEAFSGDNVGTDAMIDFMNRGNIRLQQSGFDISVNSKITPAQERVLARIIQRNRGDVQIDVSDEKGFPVFYMEYSVGTNPAKVLNDVKSEIEKYKLVKNSGIDLTQEGSAEKIKEFLKTKGFSEPLQPYLPGMADDVTLPLEKEVAYGSNEKAEEAIEKTVAEISAKFSPQNVRRAGIVSALKEKKFVDYSGQIVDGPDALAQLHQVFRSPAIETFVYYVTRPDGTIFVNRPISSGHLDQVIIGDDVFDSMFMDLLAVGDGAKLYVAHNHPSGRIAASAEDMALTQKIKRYFPRAYEGHIIIDHGKYTLIDSNLVKSERVYAVSSETTATDWRSGLKQISEPDSLADYFSDVLRAPENLHIVFLDKGNHVVAYELASPKFLDKKIFQNIKSGMARYAAGNYILMGDHKTIQSLIENGSPYGVFPDKLLDIIEVSSGGTVSYMEQRRPLPTMANKSSSGGVFEPSENYGKKRRVTPDFEAKYQEAEAFKSSYKEFRARIGKMKKHAGGFMAEELADIPAYYWTSAANAVAPDVKSTEAGFESEEAMLQAIREMEAKKKRLIPFMKEAKEIISEEREFQKEFSAGQKYGYSEGYKEATKLLREKFAEKSFSEQEMKDVIVEYVSEYLPKDLRGAIITEVRDAKTMLDAFKAFQKADEIAIQAQRGKMVDALKNALIKIKDAKNLSIEYKTMILELADSISFTTPRRATLERLQKTKDFIEAEVVAGREVSMPAYIYEGLKILDRVPVKELSLEELEFMIDKIDLAIELGKTKLKARKYLYEADKERVLSELAAAGLNKFNTIDSLDGGLKKAADWALTLNKARAPMDHFFMSIGDVAHKAFKSGMDAKYADYLRERRLLEEKTESLVENLGLNADNMERIGIYAADQQDGGREKLLNKYTEAEIDAVKLSDPELKFYEFMRAELEAIRPEYEKMLADVFNLPLGKVMNYFPFLSDFDEMSDWEIRDRFAHLAEYDPQLRKTVDLSSSIKRVDRIGVQKIRVDAAQVFSHHMDSVLYAIHLAEEIKKLQEIARTSEYGEIVGNIGQEITRQWLDVMARKGGRAQRKTGLDKTIDFLRKNISVSQLAFNPASILLQLTATMDGAMLIGHYAFLGQPLVADPAWREFAMNNSAQLKNRVGDDFAFREFGKNWWGKCSLL